MKKNWEESCITSNKKVLPKQCGKEAIKKKSFKYMNFSIKIMQ